MICKTKTYKICDFDKENRQPRDGQRKNKLIVLNFLLLKFNKSLKNYWWHYKKCRQSWKHLTPGYSNFTFSKKKQLTLCHPTISCLILYLETQPKRWKNFSQLPFKHVCSFVQTQTFKSDNWELTKMEDKYYCPFQNNVDTLAWI